MAVRRPTLDQLRSVAEDLGMHMSDAELKSYDALMQANYLAYDAVDAIADDVPAAKYPRTPGYRPEGEENKYDAWYIKTEIKGAPSGKLAGKKIALKDNIPQLERLLLGMKPTSWRSIESRVLLGDSIGISLGRVPFSILSTKWAARR
jgi:hypothetical protein